MSSVRNRKKMTFFDASETKTKKAKTEKKINIEGNKISLKPFRRIIPCEDLLVWGKCKGFGWWPGRIANRSELSGPIDRDDDPTRWIKWFGEDKFTETNIDQIAYFHDFVRFFKANSYTHNKNYKISVDLAVMESAKRTGKLTDDCNELLTWAKGNFYPEGGAKFHPHSKNCDADLLEDEVSSKNENKFEQKYQFNDVDTERNKVMLKVKDGKLNIEGICLSCGYYDIFSQHPLFKGGLCQNCDEIYRENMYLLDEGGISSFCCICGNGGKILLCDNQNCCRCFCMSCVDLLIKKETFQAESTKVPWICYMCVESEKFGSLVRRKNWSEQLHQFLTNNDQVSNVEVVPLPLPVSTNMRRPIKVLSLFDGIATGFYSLRDLGIDVDHYYASEIDNDAICVAETHFLKQITHVGDVCNITDQMLAEWGPFDLVIGGSPCNDLSIVNPARKGIWSGEGSGNLFFEFVRILKTCQLLAAVKGRFVFWVFENVVCMDLESRRTIAHFLQRSPVLLDAKLVSPAHRARNFWGNLPGMGRAMVSTDQHLLKLQDCLKAGRTALTQKLRTITTKTKSIRSSCDKGLFSGEVVLQSNLQRDSLWISEIERVFGFPDHYTDVCNMSRSGRLRLLGKSWSVPVIKHLFAPLKDYFSSKP